MEDEGTFVTFFLRHYVLGAACLSLSEGSPRISPHQPREAPEYKYPGHPGAGAPAIDWFHIIGRLHLKQERG